MSFSISFLDEPLIYEEDDPAYVAAAGKLVIGDWEEIFVSSLYLWSKEDYMAQWMHAIRSMLNGSEKAALIVEYLGPDAGRLWWWPMYRVGGSVYLREQILFFDQLKEPFSLEKAFSFIQDHRAINEDGYKISEWSVTVSEVKEFAHELSI
ncbi:MAG: hypothetical protein ABSB30_02450 [Terracidiphilus sp.]